MIITPTGFSNMSTLSWFLISPRGNHVGETLVGRSPPFVLGGIQLSGLPWSLVQARRRPCSALLCTGQPFHPVPIDLGTAPSSHLTRRVSFLFRCQPSPTTPLGVVHPAVREELPQEIPVAHPPTRVSTRGVLKAIKPFWREILSTSLREAPQLAHLQGCPQRAIPK
jgi:hypothetical protein